MKTGSVETQQSGAALAGSLRPETRSPNAEGVDGLEWWTRLPGGERALIRVVVRMLRSAKRSQVREVARAAVKWERGIGCFIKVLLIGENQRARSRQSVESRWLRVEGREEKQESGKLTPLRVAAARQEAEGETRSDKC